MGRNHTGIFLAVNRLTGTLERRNRGDANEGAKAMYIDFERVTGYRSNFSNAIRATRDEALKRDFDYAAAFVEAANLDEVADAARSGEGKLYDAMKFLVDCKYDMQALAEAEAKANAATEESVS
jgi:hypothetical protein